MSNIDHVEIGIPYSTVACIVSPRSAGTGRIPNTEIKSAWARLNDPQRKAVNRWWKD